MAKEQKVSLFEKVKFGFTVVSVCVTVGGILFYGGRWVGSVNTSLEKLTQLTVDHASRLVNLESDRGK